MSKANPLNIEGLTMMTTNSTSITKTVIAMIMLAALIVIVGTPLEAQATRTLTGQVMTSNDAPLPGAVVYLKNTKTLAVRSFTSDDKGNYRFPSLSPNVDYEIYAMQGNNKSDTKTLSAFDTRPQATINLKVK